MTPDDCNIIRDQHTDLNGLCSWCCCSWPCDATALLDEMDRLTADRDYWENLAGHALPYPEADVLRERARLLAAVEALPGVECYDEPGWEGAGRLVHRAAVITAIQGDV